MPSNVSIATVVVFDLYVSVHLYFSTPVPKHGGFISISIALRLSVCGWTNIEDRVYFWRKALKKSRKTGKNTENVAGNRKTPFWSHGKMKKICIKPEKAYFLCGKPETDPLFLTLNIQTRN